MWISCQHSELYEIHAEYFRCVRSEIHAFNCVILYRTEIFLLVSASDYGCTYSSKLLLIEVWIEHQYEVHYVETMFDIVIYVYVIFTLFQ
jgi:hypothetical protein